jgi:adenine deaminase
MEQVREVSGTVVDVVNRGMFGARLEISADGRISGIHPEAAPSPGFILPGFVDAHVHVESSMITPTAFARAAVCHGTVAAVHDPHEIANVLGAAGVEFMLEEAARTPFRFGTGAPSCVPATPFEMAGAILDSAAVATLLCRQDITHLSEVMNFPGVLAGDPEVHAKLWAARKHGKPVDGHAPGLRGADLQRYFQAGISTDHESLTVEEALEKAAMGMKIQLRLGSAARSFETLLPVLQRFPQSCMFCSDDKHPDELLAGHIDVMVRTAVASGIDLFDVLQAASLNPVRHYSLDVGLLQQGGRADWIEVEDLQGFRVRRTVLNGMVAAVEGESRLPVLKPLTSPNNFLLRPLSMSALRIPARTGSCRMIGVRDGELVTDAGTCIPTIENGMVTADPSRDLVKVAVCNRYSDNSVPAVALATGFGLREGAFAASVAHDSHNLIGVGCDDASLAAAMNSVIEQGGGLAVVNGLGDIEVMPLPVAGLMSTCSCEEAASHYLRVTKAVRGCGCRLYSPFMTLSFMALPVIPSLKLTDRGLFDVEQFRPVGFWVSP